MVPHLSTVRGRRLAPVILAMVLTMTAGTAIGGHFASAVKSYTGCLNAGTIVQVAEGNAPAKKCANGHVEVHFSGGDITAITAGTGLVGGADNGAATLALASGYQLPQGCTSAQVAKWNGSVWECAADASTTYSAGTGLELNGTEFSIDRDHRLPQNCEAGEAAAFGPTATSLGGWSCSQYALASESCPSGQFARATNADGELLCAAPTTSSAALTAYQTRRASNPVNIPSGSGPVDILALSLPAGTYLVTATGTVADDSGTAHGDEEVSSSCRLRSAGVDVSQRVFEDASGESGPNGPGGSIAVNRIVTLPSAGDITMSCESSGSDVIWYPHMTAVVIGTVIDQ